MSVQILIGDCRARMAELPDCSVDSVVCDPPYHLTSIVKRFGAANAAPAKVGKTGAFARVSKGFMGQTWDGGDVAFDPETWAEVLRVLKPGGHLVAFSGTRTYHRMAVAIEDAGFEIRDQLAWVYGSGFPKSLDVSKAIDKGAGAQREVVGTRKGGAALKIGGDNPRPWHERQAERGGEYDVTAPATEAAQQWQGWGTALKPSWEPICLARKPLIGSVAQNVLTHGTGALDIDGCRVATEDEVSCTRTVDRVSEAGWAETNRAREYTMPAQGRWPANLCHDGSEEVLAGFPAEAGGGFGRQVGGDSSNPGGWQERNRTEKIVGFGDSGSAARFFATFPIGEDEWEFAKNVHAAKSVESLCGSCGTPIAGDPAGTLTLGSKSAGSQVGPASIGICERCIPSLSPALIAASPESTGTIPTIAICSKSNGSATPVIGSITSQDGAARVEVGNGQGQATRFLYCPKATTEERGEGNNHPTVKPIALMRWLCRLVTPKGGTILDPFSGSGSTLIAADAEQFNAIGCELSPEYAAIAEKRIREAAGMFADVKVAA